jgi:hypothetical protein
LPEAMGLSNQFLLAHLRCILLLGAHQYKSIIIEQNFIILGQNLQVVQVLRTIFERLAQATV